MLFGQAAATLVNEWLSFAVICNGEQAFVWLRWSRLMITKARRIRRQFVTLRHCLTLRLWLGDTVTLSLVVLAGTVYIIPAHSIHH